MESVKSNARLTGRTILVAPQTRHELAAELERYGARVITWPQIEIGNPESFTAIDEAIENLFGYDWLLFRTGYAAEFFLRRLQQLGHEISELDSLRVCSLGGTTTTKLEESQVHVDLIPESLISKAVFDTIENYVGGRTALGRLNFLIPRASTARDELRDLLEDAGARVDVVVAYRTVANKSTLAQLTALLNGGGIDSVAFDGPSSVRELAELLDRLELAAILNGIQVFCVDANTTSAANDFGLCPLPSSEPTARAMADAMAEHFHADR